jgi:Phytanoyl-CoA dioxygenase (PhyH)
MITQTSDQLRRQWQTAGWISVPGLLDVQRTIRLRIICEYVLAQWRLRNPENGESGGFGDATVMRHLNHPGYFADRREWLIDLLEVVADQAVLNVVGSVLNDEPLFRCTSLFMNPLETSRDGNWHRDSQFMTRADGEEQALLERSLQNEAGGIQLQIALVPSADIEYIPSSHLRWDTPEEYQIRKSDEGSNNRSNSMPGAMRVSLNPGDAVAFNPMGIHRGRYHADKYRRTLMLTYTATGQEHTQDYFSSQPWFLEPGYLDGLSLEARSFFEGFIETYREFWQKSPQQR